MTALEVEWRVLMGFAVTTQVERAARAEALAAGHLIRDGREYIRTEAGRHRLREVNVLLDKPLPTPLASLERAREATDAEHAAARDRLACAICGAVPGAECTYGALSGETVGRCFPGKVHMRRLRAYLATL